MQKTKLTITELLIICFCTALLSCNSNTTLANQDENIIQLIDTTSELFPFAATVNKEGKKIIEYSDDAKKGYNDLYNNVVIKPIYQQAENFQEGLAAVKQNNLWGYIDKSGRQIIKFQYDTVFSFSSGTAYVRKNMKWGKINKSGEVVAPFIYDHHYEFNEGLALYKSNDKYGYKDSLLNQALPPIYDNATRFYNGLACVEINRSWKWIDQKGNTVISVDKYGKDYRPVCIHDRYHGELVIFSPSKNQYLFLNKKGEVINSGFGRIDFYNYYYRDNNFNEGLIPVEYNQLSGFLDTMGNIKVPLMYSQVWSFSSSLAMAKSVDDMYGFIDKNGKVVIPFIYEQASHVHYGLIVAKKDKYWGAINLAGNTVIPFIHSNYHSHDGPFYLFQLDDNSVLYNNKGNKLPPLYSTSSYSKIEF